MLWKLDEEDEYWDPAGVASNWLSVAQARRDHLSLELGLEL